MRRDVCNLELVVPCGCKAPPRTRTSIIQRWISTLKPKCAGRAMTGAVCGEAWRGDYIPVIQTEEQTSFEDSENVEALLYAAHARTLAGAELPLDHVFLATVGSLRRRTVVATRERVRTRETRAPEDAGNVRWRVEEAQECNVVNRVRSTETSRRPRT